MWLIGFQIKLTPGGSNLRANGWLIWFVDGYRWAENPRAEGKIHFEGYKNRFKVGRDLFNK